MCKLRGGNNVKKCSGIKNDVQGTWEKYFEDLYEEDTEEWAIFNMCGFDIARMSNYFTVTYAKEFSWKEINHINSFYSFFFLFISIHAPFIISSPLYCNFNLLIPPPTFWILSSIQMRLRGSFS